MLDRMAAIGPSVAAYARVAFARDLLGRREAALDAMRLALEAGTGIPEQEAWAWTQLGSLELREGRVRRPSAVRPGAACGAALRPRGGRSGASRCRSRPLRPGRDPAGARARAVAGAAVRDSPRRDLRARRQDRGGARTHRLVDTIDRLLGRGWVRTELQLAVTTSIGASASTTRSTARVRRTAPHRRCVRRTLSRGVSTGPVVVGTRDAGRSSALRLGTPRRADLFHRGLIERCLDGRTDAAPLVRPCARCRPLFSVRFAPVARRLAA